MLPGRSMSANCNIRVQLPAPSFFHASVMLGMRLTSNGQSQLTFDEVPSVSSDSVRLFGPTMILAVSNGLCNTQMVVFKSSIAYSDDCLCESGVGVSMVATYNSSDAVPHAACRHEEVFSFCVLRMLA